MKRPLKNKELRGKGRTSADGLRYLLCLLLFPLMFACSDKKEAKADGGAEITYTCPMHPQIIQSAPGSCPICGMDLVRSHVDSEEIGVNKALDHLLESTETTVISSIKTVHPVKDRLMKNITAHGIITYDPRYTHTLPIRFGGRIESLDVRYIFQPVRKGQKLLEIYSPDLVTAQRELLFLLRSDPDNQFLIEAATQKLRLLGLSDNQIQHISETGKVQNSLAIFSPYDGFILPLESAAPKAPTSAGGEMQAMRELDIREGMYVNEGESLFRIVNANKLRAEFNLYSQTGASVHVGDTVTINWGDHRIKGSVDFVQPFFDEGKNFKKIRVYLSGMTDMKVGQLVQASFNTVIEDAYWIPALAVLDLGNRDVVFTEIEEDVFRPKEISIGRRSGDMVEVQSGLKLEEKIAYSAQFMVDSESFIKIKNQTRP